MGVGDGKSNSYKLDDDVDFYLFIGKLFCREYLWIKLSDRTKTQAYLFIIRLISYRAIKE
ncbi:MAG: hypothetical protein F6K39_44710 [Okeania sp. SIO3B3]|nr:hypothetical protein [Okeania sp. SIO3B3]